MYTYCMCMYTYVYRNYAYHIYMQVQTCIHTHTHTHTTTHIYTHSVFYFLLHTDPAVIDRESPLPPDTPDERNIGAGRPDDPVNVAENVTVRLHCPYSGIHVPTTRWLLVTNNRTTTEIVDMPPDIMLINDTVNRNLILVINNFREEFEGTYRCDTRNVAGEDEGDIVIHSM